MPFLLMLLYHNDLLHETVTPEFTSKDPCISDNIAGWRAQKENGVFLAPQMQSICFIKHVGLKTVVAFKESLVYP